MKEDKGLEAEPMENPKVMGRPSLYSEDVANKICERMTQGESLRSICEDDTLPSMATVLRWAHDKPDFRDQYARARDALGDYWAAEVLRIADDSTLDSFDEDGEKKPNHANVQRARLQVDTRKWLMSRMFPKKYGDKLTLASDDPTDVAEPVTVRWDVSRIERVIVDPREEGGTSAEPEGPRMLTYQPAPPPADLRPDEWATINRVLAMIPNDSDASAAEVFGVIEAAIEKHFAAQRAEIAN